MGLDRLGFNNVCLMEERREIERKGGNGGMEETFREVCVRGEAWR